MVELEAGTVHVAVDMAGADLKRARDKGMQLVATQPEGTMTLFINLKRITDLNVRQAVNHAIDREAIIRALYQGIGEVSYIDLPNTWTMWSDSRIPTYPHDPDKARSLLNEAGWRVGPDGIRVNSRGEKLAWVMLAPTIPKWIAAAEMTAGMLKRVGIQATIRIGDFRTFETACIRGEHDLCYYEWPGGSTTPWLQTTRTYSKYFWNMTQANDPTLDKLHEESITASEFTKHKQALLQYITHVQKNSLYITVGHKPYLYVARPEVQGLHVAYSRLLYHGTWLRR